MKSFILLTFLFASCKHLPELTEKDTLGTSFCTEPAGDTLCGYNWLAPEPMSFYDINVFNGVHYSCPSVNPNNPNQFVCFKQNYLWPPEASIITYDMSTETEKTLYTFSGTMVGNLSWGKKDWIAFTQGPGTIRIFKSDGSNDHEIVASSGMNMGGGTGPAWSPDGSYIFCNVMVNNQANGVTYDTNGSIASTYLVTSFPSWNKENKIIGGGGSY